MGNQKINDDLHPYNPESYTDNTTCSHTTPLSVHGDYSDWSSWSECTVTCGNGHVTRTRSCDNPVPSDDGRNCSSMGPDVETQNCTMPSCPGNELITWILGIGRWTGILIVIMLEIHWTLTMGLLKQPQILGGIMYPPY